jgi:uncharacterized protein YdaU (DUF1376 family)
LNYYERHIGDYTRDTAHLSLLEHGVYSRLLDVYYMRESPLPADQVHRLIGCRTPQDRKAADAVLGEFFKLVDGAWRQSRCDAEIEKFASGAPEREAKQANRDLRYKRHRRERADMFRRLHAVGQHADWNIPIKELRLLVERYCDAEGVAGVAGAVAGATAPRTPPTATQSPVPRHQTPDTSTQSVIPERARVVRAAAGAPEANGDSGANLDNLAYETTEAVKAVYPAGTYRGSNWILAQREISKLLAAGEGAEDLVTHARAFAQQQAAKGSTGTQFVLSPEKFFGSDGHWRGPFPLPQASPLKTPATRMRTAHEIAAAYPEDAA